MNLEEFDNKLKKSFERENLPPKEELWQNISKQLDQKSRFNFWWVFTISAILIGATIIWQQLSGFLGNNRNEGIAKTEVNAVDINTQNQSELKTQNDISKQNEERSVSNKLSPNNTKEEQKINSNSEHKLASNNSINAKYPNTNFVNKTVTYNSQNGNIETSNKNDLNNLNTKLSNNDAFFQTQNNNKTSLNPSFVVDENQFETNLLTIKKYKVKPNPFELSFYNTIEPIGNHKKYKTNQNKAPKNFSEKWFLTFGIGPQINLNSINVSNQLKDYVHKDLWLNKDKATNNGMGFNTFALLNYRFGKGFIFESGLDYRLRTEDIKLDVTSIDIAARNNNKQIIQYANIKLLYIVGSDTTFYDAIASFNLAVKNKYNAFTIPFNLKKEFAVSDNSFLSIGLGGGVSYIYSKQTKHIDLVEEIILTETKKSALNTSFNTQLAFYTNFNDIGQIGIYSGFTVFAQPWQINQKQYSINMRDIQFGITYRKPLQW